ncbi:MAG TPA: SRPBCC domain-containing protein [Euzebyales bacterium]|nr:SRPBCC domain-containing protein [Euzebyales bacterium]
MSTPEHPRLLVREVEIAAPRPVVFRYFTDPTRLVAWIGITADLEPRPDGTFRFEVAPGEFCSGRYVEVDPPRRVAFTWGWESGAIPVPPGSTLVEVDLHASGDGGQATRLVLTHRGLAGDVHDLHDEGWRTFLARLRAVAEGREPGPDPAVRTPAEALDGLHRQRARP